MHHSLNLFSVFEASLISTHKTKLLSFLKYLEKKWKIYAGHWLCILPYRYLSCIVSGFWPGWWLSCRAGFFMGTYSPVSIGRKLFLKVALLNFEIMFLQGICYEVNFWLTLGMCKDSQPDMATNAATDFSSTFLTRTTAACQEVAL